MITLLKELLHQVTQRLPSRGTVDNVEKDRENQKPDITIVSSNVKLGRPQHPRKFGNITSLPRRLRDGLGVDVSLTETVDTNLLTYYLFVLQLKFPSMRSWNDWQWKALYSVFTISTIRPWSLDLSWRGRMSVFSIIASNAAVVQACKEGNVSDLAYLLDTGQANIRDITEDNRPLLWVRTLYPPLAVIYETAAHLSCSKYAAQHRSFEAVKFLLERHADAKATTGPYHT
jgi:hypothetical protein